jgi:hypothetical protein
LHHDPVALDFVQIKLDRCGCLGGCHVGGFDLTEDFALAAKQDDAPAALHPAGELGGAVFLAGAAGHSGNIAPTLPVIESVRPWARPLQAEFLKFGAKVHEGGDWQQPLEQVERVK